MGKGWNLGQLFCNHSFCKHVTHSYWSLPSFVVESFEAPRFHDALPFALDSICNIILSFNAKSVVIFIVKVKNRAAGKKKNEYEMILFLLNVLLTNTIIWTLSQNKALWRLEITAMIGKIKKDLKHSGQCRQGRHWLK